MAAAASEIVELLVVTSSSVRVMTGRQVLDPGGARSGEHGQHAVDPSGPDHASSQRHRQDGSDARQKGAGVDPHHWTARCVAGG